MDDGLDKALRPPRLPSGLRVLNDANLPDLRDPRTGRRIEHSVQDPLFEADPDAGTPSPEMAAMMRTPNARKSINKIVSEQRLRMAKNALSGENILRMAEALLALEDRQDATTRHPVSTSIVWNEHGKERVLQGPYRTPEEWVADVRATADELHAFGYLVIARSYRRDTIDRQPNWLVTKLRSFFRGNSAPDINPALPAHGFVVFGESIEGENIAGIYPIVDLTDSIRTVGFGIPIVEDIPSPFKGILRRANT